MDPLSPSINVVVVADAPVGDLRQFRNLLERADLVIAADGGARYLLMMGILPQTLIGDFDSLDAITLDQLSAAGVEVRPHPVHKDETDLELALLAAVKGGATCIRVLAALGGRPDQHLANLQLLTHPLLAAADVRLLHDGWEVFAIRHRAYIYGSPGDIVSLLPMTDIVTGIMTEGLYYPLQNEALQLGPARGVSNVLVSEQASVTVENGILLCMHQMKEQIIGSREE